MSESALRSQTISSFVWKFLERGGSQVVQLVVQIILARILAPEDFGALAIMLVFVNIGNAIVQSGLNTAIVQSPDADENDCSTVFWMSFVVSVVLYCVIFFLAPTVAAFYSMSAIVWPLRILCLILPFGALNSVQVAIVQRRLQFQKVFVATMVAVIVSALFGIGLAFIGAGIWALVAQQLVYQIVNSLVMAVQVRWRPRLVFVAGRASRLFSFGWKLLASGLLEQVYQSLSDLIIGKQFNASNLGLVSQGKKYPQALGSMLDGAIQPVMLSAVSRVQSDVAYVKRLVRRALKTSTFLIVPSMTLFAVAAEPIVGLLLGEKWLPCVPFLQMYCFIYALLPIHTTNLQTLNGMGRSDLFLKLELVKKAYGICLILLAAFALRDVYLMVAMYMVTGVISTFVNAWPNKRVIGYSYGEQLRDIAPAFALSAVAGGLALLCGFLVDNGMLQILVEVAVMAAVYLGLARLLHVESLEYLLVTFREMLGYHRGSKA
ncbi:MAG: lipopolysaccharide biosynthesis protein [Eggerthellaceae bacterium]|nr:lipopolysaccharide biosynthesis protein [Eggerthellaceae bacterium]